MPWPLLTSNPRPLDAPITATLLSEISAWQWVVERFCGAISAHACPVEFLVSDKPVPNEDTEGILSMDCVLECRGTSQQKIC